MLFNFIVLPHINPFDLDDEVNNGDNVQLTCHVSKGDLPMSISWSFHGEELPKDKGIETLSIGVRSSVLIIDAAMAVHSGDYTCTATNRAGSTNYSTSIFVNGI